MKNILIIGASLVVLGIMFVAAGYFLAGRNLAGFNSKNNHYEKKTYECEGDIDSIKVKESSDHLTVFSGDVDKVTVTYFDRKNEELYDIDENGGTLTVTRNSNKGFHFFEIDFTDKSTVITLPKEYNGKLDLHTSSGGMEINDVTAADIIAENTSGSMKLRNVTGDAISVENNSGGIRLENITSGSDLTVGNTSGSVAFENVTSGGDLKIKGSSGGIRIDNLSAEGDIDIVNSSGSIKFESLSAEGNINLKNTSGGIKGTIKGNRSDYKISSKTTSGGNNLTESDSGSKELNAETTSGGINIDFE